MRKIDIIVDLYPLENTVQVFINDDSVYFKEFTTQIQAHEVARQLCRKYNHSKYKVTKTIEVTL